MPRYPRYIEILRRFRIWNQNSSKPSGGGLREVFLRVFNRSPASLTLEFFADLRSLIKKSQTHRAFASFAAVFTFCSEFHEQCWFYSLSFSNPQCSLKSVAKYRTKVSDSCSPKCALSAKSGQRWSRPVPSRNSAFLWSKSHLFKTNGQMTAIVSHFTLLHQLAKT